MTDSASFEPDRDQGDLAYAVDVLSAYKFLGRRASAKTLGSHSAKELHEWAANPENREKFLNYVQKATEIISRYRKDTGADKFETDAKKTVSEIQEALKEIEEETT